MFNGQVGKRKQGVLGPRKKQRVRLGQARYTACWATGNVHSGRARRVAYDLLEKGGDIYTDVTEGFEGAIGAVTRYTDAALSV